jgi:hypothetical protein
VNAPCSASDHGSVRPVPIQTAAAEYGISVETLYRMLRRDELTRYKRAGDRRTFLDREELDKIFEYKAKRATEGGAP